MCVCLYTIRAEMYRAAYLTECWCSLEWWMCLIQTLPPFLQGSPFLFVLYPPSKTFFSGNNITRHIHHTWAIEFTVNCRAHNAHTTYTTTTNHPAWGFLCSHRKISGMRRLYNAWQLAACVWLAQARPNYKLIFHPYAYLCNQL